MTLQELRRADIGWLADQALTAQQGTNHRLCMVEAVAMRLGEEPAAWSLLTDQQRAVLRREIGPVPVRPEDLQ